MTDFQVFWICGAATVIVHLITSGIAECVQAIHAPDDCECDRMPTSVDPTWRVTTKDDA